MQAVLDTEAAVYSGQEAIDAGLADELVNSTDAITVMRDALDARKSRLSGGRMTKETQSTTVSATASLTFVQDRPSDKVWTYNRSNVVMPDDGAPFRYSFSALKDRHNAVEVNWIDPDNGWETATELVEDSQAIARYGRNVTKMDAFGCTSRGQAHRAGLWLIKTELLETQTVDFEENFWIDRISPDDGGSCHLWLGRGVPPAVNRRR